MDEEASLPVVAVIRRSDGHRQIINESDFDAKMHQLEGEPSSPEPKRRGRPRKEQGAMNGNG